MPDKLPSVVIVGRPNVGKSTIFNRLTASRRSIVTNEPGITRDRIYGTATWQERSFEVVDTGGIVPDDKAAIPREILRQAEVAIEGASQLLLVVDVRAGLVDALTSPVRWAGVLETLSSLGASRFVEVGPGEVLTGLVRKTLADVEATTVEELSRAA